MLVKLVSPTYTARSCEHYWSYKNPKNAGACIAVVAVVPLKQQTAQCPRQSQPCTQWGLEKMVLKAGCYIVVV